jgi:hypothetical protein
MCVYVNTHTHIPIHIHSVYTMCLCVCTCRQRSHTGTEVIISHRTVDTRGPKEMEMEWDGMGGENRDGVGYSEW